MRFLQWEQVLGVKQPLKSQTRRLVKPNEYALHGAPGYAELPIEAVLTKPRHIQKWVVGCTYACQRPDGQTMGRTPPIKTIRRERLGDIGLADCLAEGIEEIHGHADGQYYVYYICPICQLSYLEHRDAYVCLWNCCGGRWEHDQNEDVWVLGFESGSGL